MEFCVDVHRVFAKGRERSALSELLALFLSKKKEPTRREARKIRIAHN